MLRNCPNCNTKSVPTLKLALVTRDSFVTCKNCGLKLEWTNLSKTLSTICALLIIVADGFLFRIEALNNLCVIIIGVIEVLMYILLLGKLAPIKIKE
jgi:hypothetical protein